MRARGLRHAVFYVRDLRDSLAFYRDLLGFEVVGEVFGGRAAALRAPEPITHHELLLIEVGDRPSAQDAARGGRQRGLYHIGIHIGDSMAELKEAKAELEAAGVPIDGASDHGATWSLYVRDPDGVEVELYCDDPEVDWRSDPAAVLSPIRPLDLD